jgi:hypothetical protein
MDENTSPNVGSDLCHVPENAFEALKQKLTTGKKISVKEADFLVNWDLADGDMLVPVDMSGAGENLDEFEVALKKLGPEKTVECFVKAQKHLDALKTKPTEAKPMTAKQWKDINGEEDEEDEEEDAPAFKLYIPDLCHVPVKQFDAVSKKLKEGSDISKKDVDLLVNWEIADDELVTPVDMRGTKDDLDDFEPALEKLGAKRVAQCFVQAHEKFEANKDKLPEQKRRPITAKVYREIYEQEEEEEEHVSSAEEDADDESDDDAEEPDEPASKKIKTK